MPEFYGAEECCACAPFLNTRIRARQRPLGRPIWFCGRQNSGRLRRYMMKLISPPENFSNMDLMVLAIRGSASLEDALCDTEVQQVQLQTANAPQEFPADVRVHEQFLKQFCSLEGLIDATVHQHLIAAPSNRVLFVGHSLGASVAAIAALNYAFVFPGQVYFVGMGMPMTGNAAFQREFDRQARPASCPPDQRGGGFCSSSTPLAVAAPSDRPGIAAAQVGMRWRVKNSRDVVPKVKLSPYYAHVGRELLIGRYDPYPDLPMFSDLPDHFATKCVLRSWSRTSRQSSRLAWSEPLPCCHLRYIASLDTFSDSWWRNIDIEAILPHRVHASMINSSYKFWHYCSSWTGVE